MNDPHARAILNTAAHGMGGAVKAPASRAATAREQFVANARLVATSPDVHAALLLADEALTDASAFLGVLGQKDDVAWSVYSRVMHAIGKARLVLSKAEGPLEGGMTGNAAPQSGRAKGPVRATTPAKHNGTNT